jgi:hypothetical protein
MSVQPKSHLSHSSSNVPIHPLYTTKDISSSKNVCTTVYPRKKPSPHGISKLRGQNDSPPLYSSHSNVRKSPQNVKAEQLARKQWEAQVSALRRKGIYLEGEYQEEIQRYMLEMEVHTRLRTLILSALHQLELDLDENEEFMVSVFEIFHDLSSAGLTLPPVKSPIVGSRHQATPVSVSTAVDWEQRNGTLARSVAISSYLCINNSINSRAESILGDLGQL